MQPKILSDFCPPLPSAALPRAGNHNLEEPPWGWSGAAPLPRLLQLLGGKSWSFLLLLHPSQQFQVPTDRLRASLSTFLSLWNHDFIILENWSC